MCYLELWLNEGVIHALVRSLGVPKCCLEELSVYLVNPATHIAHVHQTGLAALPIHLLKFEIGIGEGDLTVIENDL